MTPPADGGGLVAGAEVKVGGQTLDPTLAGRLLEVRVQDNLMLPDTFLVRILDPGLEHVDSNPLDVGAEVEVLFAGSDQNTRTSVLKGQVTSLEPEFGPEGVVIAGRAYDHSHRLTRSKETHTYQTMTAGDIAKKVAGRAGLSAGTIDDAGGPHEF